MNLTSERNGNGCKAMLPGREQREELVKRCLAVLYGLPDGHALTVQERAERLADLLTEMTGRAPTPVVRLDWRQCAYSLIDAAVRQHGQSVPGDAPGMFSTDRFREAVEKHHGVLPSMAEAVDFLNGRDEVVRLSGGCAGDWLKLPGGVYRSSNSV